MKKSIWNRMFSKQGFTLVEVMVTVGILSILALGVVNQYKLTDNSKNAADKSSLLLQLNNKVTVEMSNQLTCTNNFAGKDITAPVAIASITDSVGAVIVQAGLPYGHSSGMTSGAQALKGATSIKTDLVWVEGISIKKNPGNADEMLIEIKYKKKKGFVSTFLSLFTSDVISIPMTVNYSAGSLINFCYSDMTNAVKSVIQLSCVGNLSHYDNTQNLPYGACVHDVVPRDPAPAGANCTDDGTFINNFAIDGNNKLNYKCLGLRSQCPAGQIIQEYKANGDVVCGYPFPNCTSGQLMVKTAGGFYKCLPTDIGCSGFSAIESIDSSGTGYHCKNFYKAGSCAGNSHAEQVTAGNTGSLTCSIVIQPTTCPFGQFISQVSAAGVATCTPWINIPKTCPAGQAVYEVDSAGNINCQPVIRRVLCNGAYNGHTYSNAYNPNPCPGGSLIKYSGTNVFCKVPASSCPGGWSECPTYKTTTTVACSEANSACSYSMGKDGAGLSKTLTGQGFWTPVNQQSGYCAQWMRNSGPWVFSCTEATVSITTPITEIGCY